MPTPRRPISRGEVARAFQFARPVGGSAHAESLARMLSAVHKVADMHPRDDALLDALQDVKDEYECAVVDAIDSARRAEAVVGVAFEAFETAAASRTTSGVLAGIVGRGDCLPH